MYTIKSFICQILAVKQILFQFQDCVNNQDQNQANDNQRILSDAYKCLTILFVLIVKKIAKMSQNKKDDNCHVYVI